MIKKNPSQNRIGKQENKLYSHVLSEVLDPRNSLHFPGYFWPTQCFSCSPKKTKALNAFFIKSFKFAGSETLDLRTCKVCVKYAMRFSEIKKQFPRLERFFRMQKD